MKKISGANALTGVIRTEKGVALLDSFSEAIKCGNEEGILFAKMALGSAMIDFAKEVHSSLNVEEASFTLDAIAEGGVDETFLAGLKKKRAFVPPPPTGIL